MTLVLDGSRQGVALGLHLYQPKRTGDHEVTRNISTDPLGIDWNQIAIAKCYRKLAQGKGLQNFDAYATLREEIAIKDPDTLRLMLEAMRKDGIGDSEIHNILPDMSDEDKRTLVEAGRTQYIRDVGKEPTVFWAAESAYDIATLEVLKDCGYSALVCAPEQIIQEDGELSDSRPTKIDLPSGRSIIALPFDRRVSSMLGWDSEGRKNADGFFEAYIRPALEGNKRRKDRRGDKAPNITIAYTDGETFGLHDENGHLFIIYLGKDALEKRDIDPVSINELVETLTTQEVGLPKGKLIEKTAWSCAHGLDRWHKDCRCIGNEDGSWKTPFYEATRVLNDNITHILHMQLPDYQTYLISAFDSLLTNTGVNSSSNQSLLSAKASSLASRTSCGTFFDNPWTSGYINIMFGLQAIQHLRDTGLQYFADKLLNNFLETLSYVNSRGKSAKDVALSMLAGNRIS